LRDGSFGFLRQILLCEYRPLLSLFVGVRAREVIRKGFFDSCNWVYGFIEFVFVELIEPIRKSPKARASYCIRASKSVDLAR
jgi:hypothetical protein